MKIRHIVWIAGICGRLALAARQALTPEPEDDWPNAHIEVCNGANFTQECGKVDMSEKFLGKCSEYFYLSFYGKNSLAEVYMRNDSIRHILRQGHVGKTCRLLW